MESENNWHGILLENLTKFMSVAEATHCLEEACKNLGFDTKLRLAQAEQLAEHLIAKGGTIALIGRALVIKIYASKAKNMNTDNR